MEIYHCDIGLCHCTVTIYRIMPLCRVVLRKLRDLNYNKACFYNCSNHSSEASLITATKLICHSK